MRPAPRFRAAERRVIMAKAGKRSDKQKKKELIAGLIGGGFVCALYASVFGFSKPIHLLIGIPLSLLAGWRYL